MTAFRTFILPAAAQLTAQALCKGLAGPSGDGMFEVGLSTDGNLPATHFINSGPISDEMAALLPFTTLDAEGVATTTPGMPELIPALALEAGIEVIPDEILALYSAVDISDQEPFTAMIRLGLQMVRVPLP